MQMEQGERKRSLDETIRAAKEKTIEEQKRVIEKRKLKHKIANDMENNREDTDE